MKFIFSFVCFFLCGITVPMLSEEVKNVDENHISNISYQLSRCRNTMDFLYSSSNRSYQFLKSKQKNLVKSENFWYKKLMEEKKYVYFKLPSLQILYGQEQDEEKELCRCYEAYNKIHKERIQKEKILDRKKKMNIYIKETLKKIDQLQRNLFYKGEQLRGFKDSGEFNPFKNIKGSKNLPVYGSMKSAPEEYGFSCLTGNDYEVDESSLNFILPSKKGYVSAGTWSYPQGGLHLGMDYALPMYSEIQAPANGLILYADNPVPSNNGFLGNWCGWPSGAGNSICLLCAVNDEYYIFSFAHLSNKIYVFPGQQVRQGDVLALSGNSGNSTGPHTHIEVFHCRSKMADIINYFAQTADFSFGNGWKKPATCSSYACRIRPESVFF